MDTIQEKYRQYVSTAFVKAVEPVVAVTSRGSIPAGEDGRGRTIGVELVRDAARTSPSDEAARVKTLMRERGSLIGAGGTCGNVLRIQPPLVITPEELGAAVKALEESLRAL
jgi:adenosylmethionine-8-amino-7-oxononanoate aminotransferase